jgi:exopolysaccharide biosynthesis polyprenyl glycosylphosphotransferase
MRPYRTVALMAADALLINVGFAAAYWARYIGQWLRPVDEDNLVPFSEYIPIAAFLTITLLVIYKAEGVYTSQRGATWLDRTLTIFNGTLVGSAAMIVVFFFLRPYSYSRLMFAYSLGFIVVVLAISRLVLGAVLAFVRRRGMAVDKLLIIGAGERGRALMRTVVARPELGYHIVGFLDDEPGRQVNIGRFPALGSTARLREVLREHKPDEVVIALPADRHRQVLAMLPECEACGSRVKIVPDLYEMSLSRVAVDDINGIPLISVRDVSISGWNFALKRAIDIVVSLVGLLLLSPLFALIAILIKLDSPGPVFFQQPRIGRGGKPFVCHKFRSMRDGADAERETLTVLNEMKGPMFKIKNDPRLTRMGRLFRRTSLDEFPQLINVLRGEMSLVGPRPPLPVEVAQYEEWHKKRLEVAPGMSGLWQVSGRSLLTFDEMVMLDLFYIENWSLALDLKIMLRTVPAVLLADGAY